MSKRLIDAFVRQKSEWITAQSKRFAAAAPRPHTPDEITCLKQSAHRIAHEKLELFNRHYDFCYNRVTIKKLHTRWGSCSTKGNLNFHYKLALLPEHLADYLIVHELCHLKEMNHSAHFWALVAQTIPEYAVCRRELKAQHTLV